MSTFNAKLFHLAGISGINKIETETLCITAYKLDRKCSHLLYASLTALFCNVSKTIHHISITNNAMKWSRMSEKWVKKHMFRVRQNA